MGTAANRPMILAWLGLLAAAACLPTAAVQAQVANPGALPNAQQLLQVPIGGTHVPRDRQPASLVNPYEGNSDALVQGQTLFNSMNCVGCHAPKGGGAIGPPLSDHDWIYGSAPGQIFLTIRQGRPNGMPAFTTLPDSSVWKLVAYVRSLSTPDSAALLPPRPAP